MALKLKGSTSGFVGLDAPAVAGNNTLILPDSAGSAHQILANDITAGVTTFTQVTISRNGDLTVPGTISIGGTLTYEDVTSVDSVGIVTARGLSIFGNTSGLNVASGISTFQATTATTGNFSSNVDIAGELTVAETIAHTGDTNNKISFPAADTITLTTAGSERLRIDSAGAVLINGTDKNTVHTNADDVIIGNTSASLMGLSLVTGTSGYATLQFSDGAGNKNQGQIAYNHADDSMAFTTAEDVRMRIASSGELLVNTTTVSPHIRLNQKLGVAYAGNFGGASLTNYGGTTAANKPLLDFNRSRGTSNASMTSVASGDGLGHIVFRGADGTNFVDSAAIRGDVDGTPGSSDMPGRLVFETTPDGSGTLIERLRIDSNGTAILKNTAEAVARSDFFGSLRPISQIASTWNAYHSLTRHDAGSSYGSYLIFAKNRSDLYNSNGIVQDNDELGNITFQGNDGSVFREGVRIRGEVDGTPGSNQMPSALSFWTNNGSGLSERLRIASSTTEMFGLNMTPDASGGMVQMKPSHGYQAAATDLATASSKAVLRVRTSSDSSMSLFIGAANNTARPYLQVGNLAPGSGANTTYPLLLQPFGGLVGIGELSPVNLLTISNTAGQTDTEGNLQIRYTGTSNTANSGLTVKNYRGTSQFMQWEGQGIRMGNRIITNNGAGHVYITTGSDTVRLSINASDGNFTGSSSADISDGRLKENITSISNATATIKQLLGKTFTWKEEAKLGTDTKYGFIAQELKTVLPDLVYQDVGINRVSKDADKQGYGQGEIVDDYSDDYKDDSKSEWSMAVNTSGVIPILVEAFKELEARIAALEG